MLTGIVLIGGLAALAVSNAIDRRKHPGKWEKIDAENRRKRAEKRAAKEEREYAEAMKRVPPSVWMRMSRYQKADVLLRREKAVEKRASRN